MEAATRASITGKDLGPELVILRQMRQIADQSRYDPDVRLKYLIEWIRDHQCPDLGTEGAQWNNRRLLIFTEYTDTKRYLEQQLGEATRHSHLGSHRISTFHGGIGEERREDIKAAFNADPDQHPLRILIATDAAREGVNLQNHCYDLFHFDIPWNPGRLEQRNGRIDRKLQKSPEVNCYHFTLPQRAEDRVLDVLVQKTQTIREELGSLAPLIERRISDVFEQGIPHTEAEALATQITQVDQDLDTGRAQVRIIRQELGHASLQERRQRLEKSLAELRTLLDKSHKWIGLDDKHFRDALSASLESLGVEGLAPMDASDAVADPDRARYAMPRLHERKGADPTWAATLDTLRAPRKRNQSAAEWRREAPIRPVVFKDPGNLNGEVVHLHLEHRVVQRLLGRFLSMGFRDDGLSRACVLRTDEATPQVVLLGRLSLFGEGGSRLHDEVIAVAAPWVAPETRGRSMLQPYGEGEQKDILRRVEQALAEHRLMESNSNLQKRLQADSARGVSELTPCLESQAKVLTKQASKNLAERADEESRSMANILKAQRKRIKKRQEELENHSAQLRLDLNTEEQQQLEADRKHWEARLQAIAHELESEPARVRASYDVKASRVEPVGIVYLWPLSN